MAGLGDGGAGPGADPAGESAPGGPGDGLLGEIARWVASERVARAAAERSRARSLAAQSVATATWAGVLVDLAERAAPVSVAVTGARISGRMVGVARDFCVVELGDGRPAVIRLDAITEVSTSAGPGGPGSGGPGSRAPGSRGLGSGGPGAGGSAPGGSRRPAASVSMVDVLEAAAAEASPVSLHTPSGMVNGDLVALGQDVVTLRDPGPSRRRIHVPLSAVAVCVLR